MSRYLLPGPAPENLQILSQSQPLVPNLGRQRKAITLACEPCRQRKSRCDGAKPRCSHCIRRRTECHYRTPLEQQGAYQELFRILATKPMHEGTDILRRIQSGHDVESILDHIQRADLLKQAHVVPDHYYQYEFPYRREMPSFLIQEGNQYLDSWLYKYSLSETRIQDSDNPPTEYPIIYEAPYHAAEMVERRLDHIDARKWTCIIDDNSLLRKLLETYFMTEYTFYPAFQKNYFLEDMAAGRSKYCSSLLVHAVLASACHGYSKMSHRSQFWNPRTLGYQFLAEARRLWELEIGNARLTTIQAAIVLSLVHDANGSDEVGRSYLTQAVAAAHAMHLFSTPTKNSDDLEYYARAFTAWALFGLQAVHSFHVFKAPLLSMPPSIQLSTQDDCYGDFGLRYPSAKGPVSVNYANTFRTLSEFRVIINDVAAVFFSGFKNTPDTIVDRIQGFCIRLDSWYRNLSPGLKPTEILFPWQLKLHMHYYNLIVYLLETLRMTTAPALVDDSVQKALSDAKIKMETLLRLYYLRHGFESYDIFIVILLAFIGFMHAKTLDSSKMVDLESRKSTVVLVVKGLGDQSNNCYLARVVFRLLKGSIGSKNDFLLKEVGIVEEDGEDEKAMEEQVNSSWPVDLEWFDVDPEKNRLDNMIRKTKELEF
ncbi:Nitrogen assimilation transcription factor nirA [Fusarium oxysporum f. sp. cubense]|uniref:Nitrogen assimilation transcription factor nirA n=1 Tax=Fusarium oxysporum f. sp. cubense TaxID=61366 RepID=A0A559L4F4_FUSOC|nr:Nitrogen assimilation transcription factor nirA [Fusarium oxysporum f. sp. cubense]